MGDMCVICFDSFNMGDTCRRLSSCTHIFHQQCIDSWLLTHKPRGLTVSSSIACPICSTKICDCPAAGDLAVDPATAHDLAWLAELQKRLDEDGFALPGWDGYV